MPAAGTGPPYGLQKRDALCFCWPSTSLQLRTLSLLSLSFVYPCLSFILSVSTGLQEPCVSSGAGLRDQEAVGEQLGETELV